MIVSILFLHEGISNVFIVDFLKKRNKRITFYMFKVKINTFDFIVLVSETGFLYLALAALDLFYIPGWPSTHSNSPASVSSNAGITSMHHCVLLWLFHDKP